MKNKPVRLGLMAVSSPLEVGAGQTSELLAQLKVTFEAANYPGLEIVRSNGLVDDSFSATETGRFFYNQRVDAICAIAASWFEDYLILDLLEECKVPVIAWARPGMETGSLCGVQQLGFILKQIGHPYCFIFETVDSPAAVDQAWHYTQAAAIHHRLRRAKIGWLGHRVEGMTDTTPNELALKKVFGPRIVGIDIQVFLDSTKHIIADSLNGQWENLKNQVGQVVATHDAGIEALQFDSVFRTMVREKDLSAIAVGCYPHLMGKPCLSASLLGEEGVPIACEGDVNGALAMLILTWLSNQAIHNTDLLDPIPQDNTIVFSHCGSGGFSLADSPDQIILGPVRLMDRGVCALFPAKPGIVTLINIVPTLKGYKMAALYGEAIRTEMVFPGNPLRVRFASNYQSILNWIVKEGLGHHWMAAYGDMRQPLEYLSEITGCEWIMNS